MRWPFVTRARYDRELRVVNETLTVQLEAAEGRETYWRERCERLTDAALARAGAIHEPTMVDRKAPATNPMALVGRAMNVREIDSTQH